MAKKKKLIAATTAVALSAALLLTGTFAWQSISQTALNEASDVINPGGRLHDDFNGSDKNVYVENFAEDEIFARVRFDEYMEIIVNHGGGDAQKTEVVTAGATKEDTTTYVTHKFGETNATDPYWNWVMGGADSEAAYYMPTFNLNKDSLAADVNGVFNGANFGITDKDDGNQYANYVDYSEVTEKSGYEIYDGDTNNVDELSQQHGQLKDLTEAVNAIIDSGDITGYEENLVLTENTVTHNAAQVNDQTDLIAMEDWDGNPGPFWVYDTDGWCYWAQPIASGETTGLLMDGIALDGVMDDTWYYAINVVAQFVTADDVGKSDGTGFYADGQAPSAEAEGLLAAIGVDMSGEAADDGNEDEEDPATYDLLLGWSDPTMGTVYAKHGDHIRISMNPEDAEFEDNLDLSGIDVTDEMGEPYTSGVDYTYDPNTRTLVITNREITSIVVNDNNHCFSGFVNLNSSGDSDEGGNENENTLSIEFSRDFINVYSGSSIYANLGDEDVTGDVDWGVVNTTDASITGSVAYDEEGEAYLIKVPQPGTYTVTAAYGEHTATATLAADYNWEYEVNVTDNGGNSSVSDCFPDDVTSLNFTASRYYRDGDWNPTGTENLTITWTIVEGDGTITEDGVYTPASLDGAFISDPITVSAAYTDSLGKEITLTSDTYYIYDNTYHTVSGLSSGGSVSDGAYLIVIPFTGNEMHNESEYGCGLIAYTENDENPARITDKTLYMIPGEIYSSAEAAYEAWTAGGLTKCPHYSDVAG